MIKYYIKSVCGTPRMFLVDEGEQQAVMVLTGRKTMVESDLEALKTLGIKFEQIIEPLTK